MIGFVLVGTNDLRRAIEFYDKICAAFGAKRLYQMTTGCTGVMYEPATTQRSALFCPLTKNRRRLATAL